MKMLCTLRYCLRIFFANYVNISALFPCLEKFKFSITCNSCKGVLLSANVKTFYTTRQIVYSVVI